MPRESDSFDVTRSFSNEIFAQAIRENMKFSAGRMSPCNRSLARASSLRLVDDCYS